MSIILEALKKATKEGPAEAIETEKPEIQTPDLSLPRPAKSAFISLAIITIGGLLLFFLLKDRDLPVAEQTEPRAQPTSLTLTEKPQMAAEGYTPINIFKINSLNPRLTLNGIVSGIGKPAAIIDNKIVEEDASINGARVVKIYNDKVELRNEASGEMFTIRVY